MEVEVKVEEEAEVEVEVVVEVEEATTTMQPPGFVEVTLLTVTYRRGSIGSGGRLGDLRHCGTSEGNKD